MKVSEVMGSSDLYVYMYMHHLPFVSTILNLVFYNLHHNCYVHLYTSITSKLHQNVVSFTYFLL